MTDHVFIVMKFVCSDFDHFVRSYNLKHKPVQPLAW